MAVASLVAELLARKPGLTDLADLRPYLAPVLARSPNQRADFFRIFDSFAPAKSVVADNRAEDEIPDGATATKAWWSSFGTLSNRARIAVVGLATVLLIATLVMVKTYPWSSTPAPKSQVAKTVAKQTSVQEAPLPALPAPTAAPTVAVDVNNPAGPVLDRVIDAAKPFAGAPTLDELAQNLAQHSPIHWSAEAYAVRLQELTGLPRHRPLALIEGTRVASAAMEKTAQIGNHVFYRGNPPPDARDREAALLDELKSVGNGKTFTQTGQPADTAGDQISTRNVENLSQIGFALARIETPGREPSISDLSAAAEQRANSKTTADMFPATALVETLNTALLAGQLTDHPEQMVVRAAWSPDKPLPVSVLYDRDTIARALAIAPLTAWAFVEENCLAQAIYYEARGESDAGMKAVGEVVLARVLSGKYPRSICSVVYQRNTTCQFTFACDSSLEKVKDQKHWTKSRQFAARLMLGTEPDGARAESFTPFIPAIVAPLLNKQPPWLPKQEPSGVERAPGWAAWLVLGLPLLFVSFWLLNSLVLRKAYLRRRAPDFPPLHMDLLADSGALLRSGAAMFQRISQRLQRRMATPSDRIDVEATVRATIAQGGSFVVPRFAQARVAAEYLVLIEKSGVGDQNYEYLRAMISRLKDLVALDIFTYQREPSILEPEAGGPAIPIERLMSSHPHHRLLVLGSGIHFLDPVLRKPLPGAAALTHWDRRALLTPVPLAEWAEEEYLLAHELSLPIGRATPEGLMALAEMLRLEGLEDDDLLDTSGDNLAQPLPDVMRARPQRYLYSLPPDDRPVEQIVQDLRNYLDRAGFEWLCALAVYPAVQWDLTLFLGVSLAQDAGGNPKQDPLYSEQRIAALTQLPWLREGCMPNWLRRGLIQAMSDKRGKEVRGALRTLIEAARSTGQATKDETIRIRIGREPQKDALEPHELYEDEVLLDFMAKGEIEDFEFPNANFLARFLPEAWVRRFGWPEFIALLVAASYAATAFFLSPKTRDGALVTNAWLPLLALGAGAVLIWGVLDLNRIYGAAKRALEWLGSYALGAAFVALLLLLNQFVFQFGGPLTELRSPSSLLVIPALIALYAVPLFWSEFLSRRFGLMPGRASDGRISLTGFPLRVAGFALVMWLGMTLGSRWDIAPSEKWTVLTLSGVALFALAVVSFRYGPEKLSWSRGWLMTRLGRGAIAVYAALALLPLAPAFLLARDLSTGHATLFGASSGTEVREADIIATWPDGHFFATGSRDGTVRIFDSSNPTAAVRIFHVGDGGRVTSLSLRNYESTTVVAAASGQQLYFYDTKTGVLQRAPHTKYPWNDIQVAFGELHSPLDQSRNFAFGVNKVDGSSLIGINFPEATIPKGSPITALVSAGPNQYLYGLLDGTIGLAVGNSRGVDLRPVPTIRDTYKPLEIKLPFPHNRNIDFGTIAISQDSSTAAVPSPDSNVVFAVHLETPRNISRFLVESGNTPLAVHLGEDAVSILSANENDPVRLWRLKTGCSQSQCATKHALKSVPSRAAALGVIRFSPDGEFVGIALQNDPVVRVWDRSGTVALTLKGHAYAVTSLAFSSDGTEIVTTSLDGTARIWDAKTGRSILSLAAGKFTGGDHAEFSPDGTRIVTVNGADPAHVWDARSGKKLFDLDAEECRDDATGHCAIGGASFSPDGSRIVTTSTIVTWNRTAHDEAVLVWNAVTGRVSLKFVHQGGDIEARYVPDGSGIVTVGRDGVLRVWNVHSLENSFHPGVAIRSLSTSDAASFTAVTTDGAVLRGEISQGQITKLNFIGTDDHLALGPSVVWSASPQTKAAAKRAADTPPAVRPLSHSVGTIDMSKPENRLTSLPPPKKPVGGLTPSTPPVSAQPNPEVPAKKAEVRPFADLLPELRKKYPGMSANAQGPLPDGKGGSRYKTRWLYNGIVIPVYVDAVTGRVTAAEGSLAGSFLGSKELPPVESQAQQTAPTAPERPPAPGLISKAFVVYFDFDKYGLSAEAQAVVEDAVNYYRYAGYTKCLVTGHTDTVSTREYALALSSREAGAVRDEMIRLGMNSGKIEMLGKGSEDPAVKTGPGVREPLNRRAVITCSLGEDPPGTPTPAN